MPVVGFNLQRISAEKKGQITGKLNIKNNLNITNIEQEKNAITASDEVVKINFKFNISYDPDIGILDIEGNLLLMESPEKIKKIMEEWTKDKKLDQEVSTLIFNTILARCNIKALTLEQDVNLPPHFRLPLIKPKN